MTKEAGKGEGVITRIYGENRENLVGRGIGADGNGFSNRPLEVDNNLQVIVKLDDGTVARPAPPETKEEKA